MTKKWPKVTISIPAYNQEEYIAKAIESALAQGYNNLEINISDDCSTDSTYMICQCYANNPIVNLYRNENNIGRNGNYKKLLYEYATGEWIVNLDGDDFFTSNSFISEAISYIQKADDVVLYHANFFDLRKLRGVCKFSFSNNCKLISGTDYILNRCFVDYFFHLSALYKRDAAIKCGFYSYDCLNNDALSLRTIALFGDVIIDAKKVGTWQLRDHSETNKNGSEVEVKKMALENNRYLAVLKSALKNEEFELYMTNIERASKRNQLYNALLSKDLATAKILLTEDMVLDTFYLKQLAKYLYFKLNTFLHKDFSRSKEGI